MNLCANIIHADFSSVKVSPLDVAFPCGERITFWEPSLFFSVLEMEKLARAQSREG
jgi:hypothetical protein